MIRDPRKNDASNQVKKMITEDVYVEKLNEPVDDMEEEYGNEVSNERYSG